MFCFSKKSKKLTPIDNFTPSTRQEKLAIKVVKEIPVLVGLHDLLGITVYKSGGWVFEVPDISVKGVKFWHVYPHVYLLGEPGSAYIGKISDDCFRWLISYRYGNNKPNSDIVEELYTKYGIE